MPDITKSLHIGRKPAFIQSQMTLPDLNACDEATFVTRVGGAWEHSPWIARRAASALPFDSVPALQQAMWEAVCAASASEQMALITAHPDLAGKLARARRLTSESTVEQASAGLDALTSGELTTFNDLNARYRERFGFPFIICVREHSKPEIVAAFHRRLENSRDAEIHEALEQIRRIANGRIQDLIAA
jgi:OHCU decarboxylase